MPNHPFPRKTALALATALAALAIYRLVDKTKGLSPTIFPEATHLTLLRHKPAKPTVNGPLAAVTQTANNPAADTNPCQWNRMAFAGYAAGGQIIPGLKHHALISPNLVDDCGILDPFFAALRHLEVPSMEGPK